MRIRIRNTGGNKRYGKDDEGEGGLEDLGSNTFS